MLSCSCRLEMICQETPMTQTVFPKTEEALRETENQKALAHVPGLAEQEDYRSVMDWLFCCVYPGERAACFCYYKDDGPSLKESKSRAELLLEDRVLLGVVKKARKAFEAEEEIFWAKITLKAALEAEQQEEGLL